MLMPEDSQYKKIGMEKLIKILTDMNQL